MSKRYRQTVTVEAIPLCELLAEVGADLVSAPTVTVEGNRRTIERTRSRRIERRRTGR